MEQFAPNEADRMMQKLAAQEVDLSSQKSALEERIKKLDIHIDTLTEEAEVKHRERNVAFVKKHTERFKDIEIKRALVFGGARHVVSIGGGAKFIISVPTGEEVHRINKFIRDPINSDTASPGKEAENLGPISDYEEMLLGCLVAAQMGDGPEQKFDGVFMPQKLTMIRSVPAPTARRIADECVLMQSYLNAVLETEMGN